MTIEEIKELSNSEPMHIGQNRINASLYDFLQENYFTENENKNKNKTNLIEFKLNSEFIDFTELNKIENNQNIETDSYKHKYNYEM